MALACAPASPARSGATATTPATTTPVADPPQPDTPTTRISADVGDTLSYDLDADSVTVEQGERLLGARYTKQTRTLELTAMAPGQARLVVQDDSGRREIIVEIPEDAHNRCNVVKRVPIDGLVAVEHAREYRHVASSAGELHVMSVGAAVSFDGPGTLLLMTSDEGGVARCTRFEADDPGSCETSVVLVVGTTTTIELPNTSRVLLHEEHVTERWENDNKTLVVEGKTPGVATLWLHHGATGWQCTRIEVAPP